jgi:amino acid adenylation domain-containing protein
MLVHDWLRNSAARAPEAPAIEHSDGAVTYAALSRRAQQLAALLRHAGVKHGDRVVLLLENAPETVIGVFATLLAGATFTVLNSSTKRDKLAFVLRDTEAAALLTASSHRAQYGAALEKVSSLRCVVVARQPADVPFTTRLECAWPDTDSPIGEVDDTVIDADLACIIYTSGSTGTPKGVALTHRNVVAAADSVSQYLGLRPTDRIFCALPLAFDYGLYQVLMAVRIGATVILEQSFVYPARALEVMARGGATVFPGVPTMFAMLIGFGAIDRYDLSALRLITSTAAALPEAHIGAIRRAFPGVTFYSMYGLTECKRVSYLPPDQLDLRPNSVGRGMPNQELWLVDDAGRRLANGSQGELVVRGSHVMAGYWRRPGETEERLRPGAVPGERVLYTGDIFRTDEDGYLYFVARRDDIIKSRGEKVSPREVENVLSALSGVAQAAVLGAPDPLLGEAIVAYVVVQQGSRLTERDIFRHCLDHLEQFMVPKSVTIVPSLPMTSTGKVDKRALRDRRAAEPAVPAKRSGELHAGRGRSEP